MKFNLFARNIKSESVDIKTNMTADDILTGEIFKKEDDVEQHGAQLDNKDESVNLNFGGKSEEPADTAENSPYYLYDICEVELLNATTLYLSGYVGKYAMDTAIKYLNHINRHINIVEFEYPDLIGKIVPRIFINSPGGSVTEGMRLHDRIKSNKYPITCIIDGMAASMGAVIATAGAKTLATVNSTIMIHQLSAGTGGKYQEMIDYIKYFTQLQDVLGKVISENTKCKREKVNELMARESFILAPEAVSLGLIDGIIEL